MGGVKGLEWGRSIAVGGVAGLVFWIGVGGLKDMGDTLRSDVELLLQDGGWASGKRSPSSGLDDWSLCMTVIASSEQGNPQGTTPIWRATFDKSPACCLLTDTGGVTSIGEGTLRDV